MAHVQENQVGKLGFHAQMNRHLLWMRVSDYQGIRGVELLPRKQSISAYCSNDYRLRLLI